MKSIEDKLNTFYGVKSIPVKIEDIDESNRLVKGYFSSFDVKDSDNDIIRKGSFKKSIQERGPETSSKSPRRIQHLRYHDWEHQIGNIKELFEDNFGLGFVSKMGRATKGNDALLDYQDEIIKEHSIGFNYVKGKITKEEDSEGEFYNITELFLMEGSAVSFGANEFTPNDTNKSILDGDYLEKLNNEMSVLIKALRNGKGTDERLENIDLRLKQIQQKYNSLIELKSFDKNTLTEPSPEEVQKALKTAQEEELRKMLIGVLSK